MFALGPAVWISLAEHFKASFQAWMLGLLEVRERGVAHSDLSILHCYMYVGCFEVASLPWVWQGLMGELVFDLWPDGFPVPPLAKPLF